jgi:DNA helicase-2/ATP-dependent DNA helicase PcrA
MKGDELLQGLNPVQREAVMHTEGPVLILAGAGSGKTRVLTHRVAYLVREKNVSPGSLLAVTFTNKAAGEMRNRIQNLVGPSSQGIWMATFHSTCARILRVEGERLGYRRNFIIYDADDQLRLITRTAKQLELDPKRYPPRLMANIISNAKNALQTPGDLAKLAEGGVEDAAAEVYKHYQETLRRNDAMDFDDLLMQSIVLFERNPEVLEHYQERFRYINIDEYQDTNHAQYRLVNMLARKHRNLCVVGDDDQSNYSWRGADINNILSFEHDYPEAAVYKLEQNYRSTQLILEVANHVIAENQERKPKALWTENAGGEPVVHHRSESGKDEAYFAAREVERLVADEGYSLRDIAVFYRVNAQSRLFEEVFLHQGIPYKVVGGAKFYERREVKDMLAYLRLLANPQDSVSLRRVINVPKRGIGDTSVGHVDAFARLEGLQLNEALGRVEEIPELGPAAVRKMAGFMQMLEELRADSRNLGLPELVEKIWSRTGYMAELEAEKTVEAESRSENLKELQNVVSDFERTRLGEGLDEFLEQVALITDIDLYDEEEGAVTLMTIHNAKGLEYPIVFMVGMEDGVFPHMRSVRDRDGMEEERRLCYVGITRAKEKLYLVSAVHRTLYGGANYNPESRFLRDIPEELMESTGIAVGGDVSFGSVSAAESEVRQARLQQLGTQFRSGDRVYHAKWGEGTVLGISLSASGPEVTVYFPDEGEKHLLLEYAPLKKL